MNKLIEKIGKIGIVPVIALNNAKDAEPLAKALCEGGLPCAEVTFRTDAAAESIRIMKEKYPEMVVGAGTVLTTEQVDAAVAAGAEFLVSPGLNPAIVKYCVERDILILPGCANPSDVEQAIQFGLEMVKFFPAEVAGGLKYIKSIAAPYTKMMFMPTGGINASNINDYLGYDRIVACGGSWMVPGKVIEANDFDQIKKLTEEAVQTMLGFKIAHVGINCENEQEAGDVKDTFHNIFNFEANENKASIFMDKSIEIMKTPFLGAKGHIAISSNSVERGKDFLERKGISFNEDSVVYRSDGKMQAVYMRDEIGGFAIHLVRNPELV